MFKLDAKKIIISVFAILVLVISWMLARSTSLSEKELSAIFVSLPYILAFFALVLSVWFQHSRFFYAICAILFSIIVLSSPGKTNIIALRNGISLLIPIIFTILAVTEERGITSKPGLKKGICIIVLMLFILIDSGRVNPYLAKLKPAGLMLVDNKGIQGIPRLSVFLFIVCLSILLTRFLSLSSNMDMAFVGATLGCFVILHFTEFIDILSFFSTAVFFIFIISMFEASYSLAFHDTLTGLLTRRAMEQEFLRIGNKYTLAIIDIDHFKKVNDNFGHQVGDEILKMVASTIEKYAKGGKVFRYGGEEFVVIFPRKTIKDTLVIFERIRYGIQERSFVIRSSNRPKKKPEDKSLYKGGTNRIRVTVSIGIAEKSEDLCTSSQLVGVADKALYQAKSNGRNCIRH